MDVDGSGVSAAAVHPRVNGALLAKYVGKSVLLVGQVLKVDGDTAMLRASDGMEVSVTMQPGSSYNTQYVEVLGVVVNSSQVNELQAREFEKACGKFSGRRAFGLRGADASLTLRPPLSPRPAADLDNYNELVQLANGPFSDIFA